MISIHRLTVAVFFLALLPIYGYALTADEVFEKVKDEVFVVRTLGVQGKLKKQGSGVLISSNRVATNYHVVKGGVSFQVGQGKQTFPATINAYDEAKDAAPERMCLANPPTPRSVLTCSTNDKLPTEMLSDQLFSRILTFN